MVQLQVCIQSHISKFFNPIQKCMVKLVVCFPICTLTLIFLFNILQLFVIIKIGEIVLFTKYCFFITQTYLRVV